ncbi:NADH dehydrogenase [ubiquinone] 1 alpha subcomplex subunit 4-like 2 isoform X1 [Monodelphis domestica]|uniref:NADH dehydrogenase [ubiquinone] 1 alpha subcomplex subunit 4-like 2 isoform X1 n=1 Tax=Monodelphis domestica TaxID=13616 RepID=UPI0024E1E53C|nr:NADH dehydrogenase [ubiquinone] 1 alpha subcomplex subunit 4-like 2 isoform X1 [Monodelphis domestica]
MLATKFWDRFIRQVKRNPGLIPLISFIGLGMGSAALYLLRLALRSPDVSWDRKNNPEPWNRLSPNDQYKVTPAQHAPSCSLPEPLELGGGGGWAVAQGEWLSFRPSRSSWPFPWTTRN